MSAPATEAAVDLAAARTRCVRLPSHPDDPGLTQTIRARGVGAAGRLHGKAAPACAHRPQVVAVSGARQMALMRLRFAQRFLGDEQGDRQIDPLCVDGLPLATGVIGQLDGVRRGGFVAGELGEAGDHHQHGAATDAGLAPVNTLVAMPGGMGERRIPSRCGPVEARPLKRVCPVPPESVAQPHDRPAIAITGDTDGHTSDDTGRSYRGGKLQRSR